MHHSYLSKILSLFSISIVLFVTTVGFSINEVHDVEDLLCKSSKQAYGFSVSELNQGDCPSCPDVNHAVHDECLCPDDLPEAKAVTFLNYNPVVSKHCNLQPAKPNLMVFLPIIVPPNIVV